MRTNQAEQVFTGTTRAQARAQDSAAPRRHSARHRTPSTAGYMMAAAFIAAALFFLLWWMLHNGGEDAPWLPAALAATVVMLVAVAAREVVMRRAWTRYLLEQDMADHAVKKSGESHGSRGRHIDRYVSALRAVQKASAEADAAGPAPDAHLRTYRLCKDYLADTEEALRHRVVSTESRVALRAGQERVRSLQKHHMLAWVRTSSYAITQEAQRRVLFYDKIETAMRALDVIDEALKSYPDEKELHASALAVHEFMASVRIGRWVEMAERAAFKGHLVRAIDRYRDALFYLSREEKMSDETRGEAAERIWREIEMLRARLKTNQLVNDPAKKK